MFGLALAIPFVIAHILRIDRDDINLLKIALVFLPISSPFALLGILALRSQSIRFAALKGAAIGAILAVGIPHGYALYRIAHYSGGGADIGLGLILLGEPLYIILAMTVGWNLGNAIAHQTKS